MPELIPAAPGTTQINDLAERRERERIRRLELVTAEHERICALMGWDEDA